MEGWFNNRRMYLLFMVDVLFVGPPEVAESTADAPDGNGNGEDVNGDGGNGDGVNVDPDESDDMCLDMPQSEKLCRLMKQRGCNDRDLAKKKCRKSCDMCGKNISMKRVIIVKTLKERFFNQFSHFLSFDFSI